MLRNLARGLLVVALVFCIRAAWAAGTADQSPADEVRAGLKILDGNNDRSAATRIKLANIAINAATAKAAAKDAAGAEDCWEAARDALQAALRLDPTNREAPDLMAVVQKHIVAPATKPATPVGPPAATKPAADTKPAAPVAYTAKRPASVAEINRIRQIEWKHDESPSPGIRVDQDVRNKYVAANPDLNRADFLKLSQDAQAAAILDSDKSDFYPGVHIARDPASIREFKTAVERVIEVNCATCHTANKAGHFNLFADKGPDADAYSNFLILQKYTATVNGAERLMVDRTTPESSLLLQFLLPAEQSDAAHPAVPNFKPPAKAKTDAKYQIVLKWLQSLAPLAPAYGIDLSADAPAPVPAPGPPPKK